MKNQDPREFFKLRVHQLMRQRGITSMRKLSHLMGKDDGYIQRLLSPSSTPTVDQLSEICNYFNCSEHEFYSVTLDQVKSDPISPDVYFIFECSKQMPERHVKKFADLLRTLYTDNDSSK